MNDIVHKLTAGTLGIAALVGSAPAFTQAASNSGVRSEYRLTDQEKERILATAEARGRNRESTPSLIGEVPVPPAIEGEIGFSIGTDGSRSAFGSAFYPFGGNSGAAISFDFDRFGKLPQPLVLGNPNR